ncbi:MAG: cobyric acid synthase [Frisingicoccus sp.]|uniref:cobyric acid synthase n=1 Tax=Frisingicoccus sp. TaxID=1918627 RepID=UPI0026295C71|nr:cobyric acid synthase [Frisingicoccus sp.]MDD6232918.1 cobyric acid synthase [Frisingicoccus sp.]
MSKVIMIQGTMSNAGKSLLTAGLCRIMKQDGYRVAPFKSQNMALNSFITEEGLEMGRAQVMQAEAAGIRPMVCMNPILLKPTSHTGSQVIVNGEVVGNMGARDYFKYKTQLIPEIKKAFRELEKIADIIVIEGAGSPAEINLRENDIVNMGMAEIADAPVLLVGDIDRGGVFAQLLGTLMLLGEDEKSRVKGLIINKFRGDKTILDPGIEMLEERGGVPVVGVIPYMELALEDEDSLTERFRETRIGKIDMAVIRYPRISNFTDFNVFEQLSEVSVRYVTSASELGHPDIIFLPGSKNTIRDLKWMRQNGLEAAVKKLSDEVPVFGICGGYQMLGKEISDPEGVEEGGKIRGMELLDVMTELKREKTRCQTEGKINKVEGIFSELSGMDYSGYEIHMGCTTKEGETPLVLIGGDKGNVYGSYVHGIFDRGHIASAIIKALADKKGLTIDKGVFEDYKNFKERQYDHLADTLRAYLNMEDIYGMLNDAHLK